MISFLTNKAIGDTERKNFSASIKFINNVRARIQNMDITQSEKEKKTAQLIAVLSKCDSDTANQENYYLRYRALTMDDVAQILPITDMTVPEFWSICYEKELQQLTPEDADLNDPKYKDTDRYISADVSNMYRVIDGLSDERRREMGKIAMLLTPTFWHSELDEALSLQRYITGDDASGLGENTYLEMGAPGRVWALLKRKGLRNEAERLAELAPEGSDTKSMLNAIRFRPRESMPIAKIPAFCNVFGFSLHHMIGMTDDVKLYAQKQGTEKIITAYTFMSEANKDIFRQIAKKEEGVK